jgi:hypothetical protein
LREVRLPVRTHMMFTRLTLRPIQFS